MKWTVGLHDDFAPELAELAEEVQDELLALMGHFPKSDLISVGRAWIPLMGRATPI